MRGHQTIGMGKQLGQSWRTNETRVKDLGLGPGRTQRHRQIARRAVVTITKGSGQDEDAWSGSHANVGGF